MSSADDNFLTVEEAILFVPGFLFGAEGEVLRRVFSASSAAVALDHGTPSFGNQEYGWRVPAVLFRTARSAPAVNGEVPWAAGEGDGEAGLARRSECNLT